MSFIIINWIINIGIFSGIGMYFKKFNEHIQEKPEEETNIPNIVSMLGVLGTFIGIFLGLFAFNTNNIEASIPSLLEGMKTAFITSIAGMLASIYMKNKQEQVLLLNEEGNIDYEDSIEVVKVIIDELKAINSTLSVGQQQISDRFKEMDENSIRKQEEILGVVKLFNSDFNTKQQELIKEFKVFAETLAEQNSKSLIEALNDVIKDFNNKITEQFGENFKQLNEAVGELLVWQENYKEHIDHSEKQLQTTIEAIIKTEEATRSIAEKANVLISISEKLEPTLIGIDNNQKSIQSNMETLAKVTSDAKEAIPTINDYLDTVFKQVKNNFENSTSVIEEYAENYFENFNEVVEELRTIIPDINDNMRETTNEFNLSLTTFRSEIGKTLEFNMKSMQAQLQTLENATSVITENLDGAFSSMSSNMENVNTDISEQIRNMIENSEERFKGKVDQLHKTLEVELNNSLRTLGTQLVQISNRFAHDYIPLADKLKQIVSIAEGVN